MAPADKRQSTLAFMFLKNAGGQGESDEKARKCDKGDIAVDAKRNDNTYGKVADDTQNVGWQAENGRCQSRELDEFASTQDEDVKNTSVVDRNDTLKRKRRVILDDDEEDDEIEDGDCKTKEDGQLVAQNNTNENDEERDDEDYKIGTKIPSTTCSNKVKTSKSKPEKAASAVGSEGSLVNAERLLKADISVLRKCVRSGTNRELKSASDDKSSAHVSYTFLTDVFEDISNESGRLIITEKLTNAFRAIIEECPGDLLSCVYLASGTVAPPYQGLELGGTS